MYKNNKNGVDKIRGILYYYTEKHKTYNILEKVLYNTGRLTESLSFVFLRIFLVKVDFFMGLW